MGGQSAPEGMMGGWQCICKHKPKGSAPGGKDQPISEAGPLTYEELVKFSIRNL